MAKIANKKRDQAVTRQKKDKGTLFGPPGKGESSLASVPFSAQTSRDSREEATFADQAARLGLVWVDVGNEISSLRQLPVKNCNLSAVKEIFPWFERETQGEEVSKAVV